jgi:anti-sigma factor RsiW
MKQNTPTDEELMALADGALPPAEAARLSPLVEADPELREKVEMFRATRDLVREARDAIGAEPVPDALRQSIEAMIAAQAKPQPAENVVAFRARPAAAAPAPQQKLWAMPIAASLITVFAGVAGYVIGKDSSTAGGPAMAEVGGLLPAPVATALATKPSGVETALADGRIRVIATVRTSAASLCREFELDQASGQTVVGIGCREGAGWRLDIAVAAPQTGEGFAPASSLNAIESYLGMIEAGEPLSAEEEAAALLEAAQ